jgi:glutamate 5-kinase
MKRITLKVGSGVLTENNAVAKQRMLNLVSFIVKLKEIYDVILVSSGAVSSGYTALKLDRKKHISKKVLAAVGQPILMSNYKALFDIYDVDTSQVLMTEEDFDSVAHVEIFRQIIDSQIEHAILPIVNENDITTISEQVFGDNDQLSAHVAHYSGSEMLVILSDIDGYYDKNPNEHDEAVLYKLVSEIPPSELLKGDTSTHEFATGGIVTKLKAAQFMLDQGREMFLCNGYDLTSAEEFLIDGQHNKGTLFSHSKK